MKKIYLLALCMFCLLGHAQSQTSSTPNPNESWSLILETADLKIYGLLTNCGEQGVVFLKMENTGSKTVKVSWKRPNGVLTTNPSADVPDSFEITIIGAKTVQGSCSTMTPPALMMVNVSSELPVFDFHLTVVQ